MIKLVKGNDSLSASKIKLWFFLLLIPTIVLGELMRFLHNVRPYTLPNISTPLKIGNIRSSDGNWVRTNYTGNSDKVVVVIHGYLSSSKRSLTKYGKFLSEHGYDIIAVDLRNHGRSSLSLPVSAGYYERLDVIAVLKWAKGKWDQVHIIGSSMGAYAVIYALADLRQTEIIPNSVILESFGTDLKVGTRDTFIELYKFPITLASIITSYISIRSPVLFERNIIQDINSIADELELLVAHGSLDQIYHPNIIQGVLAKKLHRSAEFTVIEGARHSELWKDERFLQCLIRLINTN